MKFRRRLWGFHEDEGPDGGEYVAPEEGDRPEHDTIHEADLVGSLTETEDVHLPVIDLDFPCALVPSRTPGHFHLYIDHPTATDDFFAVLDAMVKAGWVQQGYLHASEARGQTFVRIRPQTPCDIHGLPHEVEGELPESLQVPF